MNTKSFVKMFTGIAAVIVVQNMISYSANVADNVMLGAYSQAALSGATVINQIQFVFQQMANGLGEGLVTICSRFWGRKQKKPIYYYTWIAVIIGLTAGIGLTLIAAFFPMQIMQFFTKDSSIINEGIKYLSIIKFTYIPFVITTIIIAALRSMERVNIGFFISLSALGSNIILNYLLIYGKFGFPELGITGAAIATLIARLIELIIAVSYICIKNRDIVNSFLSVTRDMLKQYLNISFPIVIVQTLFGISIGLQTAILGHMSSDAIAANSVATTIFQYLKIIAIGSSSATVVVIGKIIGSGKYEELKKYKKILQFIYVGIGLSICLMLNLVKRPLVDYYSLTESTKELAVQIITVLSIVAIGMAYQMPTNNGIIRGGGDTKFALKVELISIWGIMYPVSLLAAFVLGAPPIVVVALLNSDQIFKCLPVFIKANWFYKVKEI